MNFSLAGLISNDYLRKLKIDEKETMECNQKMNELKTQIEEERKNIKKSMFGNKIMKFEANTNTIDGEILGKLVYSTFNFTLVIFTNNCWLYHSLITFINFFYTK